MYSRKYFKASELFEFRMNISKQLKVRGLNLYGKDTPNVCFDPDVDFNKFLVHLKHLKLKPEYRLIGFVELVGNGTRGGVYAIPAGVDPLKPGGRWELLQKKESLIHEDFRPKEALRHYMLAFESDGSPDAYMEASILGRELQEFGADWHGCSWSTNYILDTPVRQEQEFDEDTVSRTADDKWKWEQDKPDEWRPYVQMNVDGTVEVVFLTFSALGLEGIYCTKDLYSTENLLPENSVERLAEGVFGFVF